MNLDELCRKLVEHGLIDQEKFRPNFSERIMREGGGTPVLQNQDTDIIANIQLFEDGTNNCIQSYSPEKVEAYFFLQELANHARGCFYNGANKGSKREDDKKERRGFTEHEREKIEERLKELSVGFYKSREIGEPMGFTAKSIGGFLSHLDENERRRYGIRYLNEKNKWEKY